MCVRAYMWCGVVWCVCVYVCVCGGVCMYPRKVHKTWRNEQLGGQSRAYTAAIEVNRKETLGRLKLETVKTQLTLFFTNLSPKP